MSTIHTPSASVSPRSRDADQERTRSVVWVGGEQDVATRAELSAAIAEAAARDGGDVGVDLSAVTFMDASTIGAIIGGRNLLRARSRVLLVRAPSRCARRLLELCELGWIIEPRTPTAPAPRTGVARGAAGGTGSGGTVRTNGSARAGP